MRLVKKIPAVATLILLFASIITVMFVLPVCGSENLAEEYKSDTIIFMKLSEKLKGDGNGNYSLDRPVTREEYAVLLDRIAKMDDKASDLDFSDYSEISDWAKQSIQNGIYYGYINGYPTGEFRPYDDVTYEEAVKMALVAKDEKNASLEFPNGFTDNAEFCGLLYGVFGDLSYPITRGDAVVLLYNTFPSNIINLSEHIKAEDAVYIEERHEKLYSGYKVDFNDDGLFEYITVDSFISAEDGIYISIYDSEWEDCWYEAKSHTYRKTKLEYAGDMYEVLRDTDTGIYYLRETIDSETRYYEFSRPSFEEVVLKNTEAMDSIIVYDYQKIEENASQVETVSGSFDR